MIGNFREIFFPTPEEEKECRRRYADIIRLMIKEKACCTCKHYVVVHGYHPGFVTGGDAECDTGRIPIETCFKYELGGDMVSELEELERGSK